MARKVIKGGAIVTVDLTFASDGLPKDWANAVAGSHAADSYPTLEGDSFVQFVGAP